jgi:hypothetical protein
MTEDFPMPEYPETNTNSGTVPDDAVEGGDQHLDVALLPYSLSGISSRSGVSCWCREIVDAAPKLPFGKTTPQIPLKPAV